MPLQPGLTPRRTSQTLSTPASDAIAWSSRVGVGLVHPSLSRQRGPTQRDAAQGEMESDGEAKDMCVEVWTTLEWGFETFHSYSTRIRLVFQDRPQNCVMALPTSGRPPPSRGHRYAPPQRETGSSLPDGRGPTSIRFPLLHAHHEPDEGSRRVGSGGRCGCPRRPRLGEVFHSVRMAIGEGPYHP